MLDTTKRVKKTLRSKNSHIMSVINFNEAKYEMTVVFTLQHFCMILNTNTFKQYSILK